MADDRLIEIVADLLDETRQARRDSNNRFERLENQLERLVEQQAKTNLSLSEMRLSNMKLAERIAEIVNLDQRVRTLENIVLPKAS